MKREKKAKSYKEIVKIPSTLIEELPTSFDITGQIALVKLKDELLPYKKEIADALLEINKNIQTVCLTNPVSGELRTRQVEIISGKKSTETTHREYGLLFNLDISKAYFSPRLASERKRVADLVKKDEIIVDMFTGVAPFPIMIAKFSEPKKIFAIDKNRDAINYAKINVTRNKVLDKIDIIHADARKFIPHLCKDGITADRIIMNLPFSSFDFFEDALKIAKENTIVNYYDMLTEENINKRIAKLKEISEKNEFTMVNSSVRKIKSYSPREFYIGIDITVKKI